MKKKKLKSINYESNDIKEIKSLIIITIVVIAIAVGLFFLTNYLNNKKATSNINIDYDTCIVGNMFNRPYNEYYVFLYSSTDKNASTYKGLITSYKDKDDALKVYYVDMNDKFNNLNDMLIELRLETMRGRILDFAPLAIDLSLSPIL